MRWPNVALGDVMTLAHESHPVEPNTSYPNIGIYSFGRGVFSKPPIESATTSATTLYRVKAGQVIYSRLFAFEGAYTTVPAEFDGAFVSNEFPTFSVRSDRALSDYLGWLFRWSETWRLLRLQSVGLGDRRQRVHPERLLAHEVPLPPLDEQQRIVARLDKAAGAVVSGRNDTIAMDVEIAATLRASFKRVAADAPRARMGDVAPLVRRPIVVDLEATYPELGVRSFGKGTFHKPSLPGLDVGSKKLFSVEMGDLIFNIVFAWEGAVAVAAEKDSGRVGSHRFLTCVADPKQASANFLRYWFLSEEGLLALNMASPGGAGRNRTLGIRALEAIAVPMPSLDAQRWFDRVQAKARAARAAQADAATHLDRLLPALLHETFA